MKNLLRITLALVFPAHLWAQGNFFSQFYSNPSIVNPAYVSVVKGVEASVGYRKQWGQVQDGLHSRFANVSIRMCRAPLAFGAYVEGLNEPYFEYKEQEGGIRVGAFIPTQRKFSLHGAFQAGIGQHRVDYQKLLFTGQLDPVFGVQGSPSGHFLTDGSSIQTFKIGFGSVARGALSWRNGDLPASVGFSVLRLFGSREVSFLRIGAKQDRLFTLHGAITTPITAGWLKKDVLYLNWIARFDWESALTRANTGVILQYEQAHLGLVYQWNRNPAGIRNTHSLLIAPGVDIDLGDQLKMRLSYGFDGVISGLGQSVTAGAHEIIAVFSIPDKCLFKGKNSRGRTDCFDFVGKGYNPFLN